MLHEIFCGNKTKRELAKCVEKNETEFKNVLSIAKKLGQSRDYIFVYETCKCLINEATWNLIERYIGLVKPSSFLYKRIKEKIK